MQPPPGAPPKLALDVDACMAGQRGTAPLVLRDGPLRLARHGLERRGYRCALELHAPAAARGATRHTPP
jgi:hypothetical protein